jgi:protease I
MFERVERFFRRPPPLPERGQRSRELTGVHVAVLATDGFAEGELLRLRSALETEGAVVHLVSPTPGRLRGWARDNWSKSVPVELTVREAWSVEFDALFLPGGVLNTDHLRENAEAVAFVMSFVNKGRPVAASGHGVQLLVEAGAVKHKRLTGAHAVRTDLANAGAHWVDKDVAIDHKIITARSTGDLSAFTAAVVREFAYGRLRHHEISKEGFDITF